MNAVLFTTNEATSPTVVEMTPSGFTLAGKKNGVDYTEATDTIGYDDELIIKGTLSGSITGDTNDVVEVKPDSFVYTLSAEIPASGWTANATVVGTNISAATVDVATFANSVDNVSGTYVFNYDGNAWKLNNTSVTLSSYGITVTGSGTPVTGDKITVDFFNGNAIPVQLTTRTYLDKNGKLHLQPGLTSGTKIYVDAICTYQDPSGRASLASSIPFTDRFTVTIG
jgi:hypothetical protein